VVVCLTSLALLAACTSPESVDEVAPDDPATDVVAKPRLDPEKLWAWPDNRGERPDLEEDSRFCAERNQWPDSWVVRLRHYGACMQSKGWKQVDPR